MIVSFYYRKPNVAHKSIELIFSCIAEALRPQTLIHEKISPFPSLGFLQRCKAVMWAHGQRNTSDVHHVTGDIHFLVLGLPGKKTILTIHDLSFLKKGNWLSRFVLWLFWVYLPVWWVKQVTCVSDATKRDILKYTSCDAGKVMVIPNFVKSEFKRTDKIFNKLTPVILQIGTAYNKNIERLAKAVKNIPCHVRIIGRLSQSQLHALQQNNVQFSNAFDLKDEELVGEYEKCDILSFCSTMEGFGLPIIEAQTVGRVIITGNISSMPEVAGDAACFVDPWDILSITAGIQRVINDNGYRQDLIEKGFRNAKKFDIVEVSQKYGELYSATKIK